MYKSVVRCLKTKYLLIALGVGFAGYLLKRRRRAARNTANRAVVITGCDSGLGYSFALHCSSIGLTVFAGCLDPESASLALLGSVGAETGRLEIVGLDITDEGSVKNAIRRVQRDIDQRGLELIAVVNNAGIMIFGEFDWLTREQVQRHIDVNLLGTMLFTKAIIPMLIKHKGRLVNVLSHCALEGLPGLASYCASKAGLKAWSDGLRVELAKFGVDVVNIIPGGFVSSSRLLAGQSEAARQMREAMSGESKARYGEYFTRYMNYLDAIPVPRYPTRVDDPRLYDDLDESMFSDAPRGTYARSPSRYAVYHGLFAVAPRRMADRLKLSFMSMPEWRPADGQLAITAS